jgi:hypothetical protein
LFPYNYPTRILGTICPENTASREVDCLDVNFSRNAGADAHYG